MLTALKVGQEIEYQYTTGRNRWTKHSGMIQQITDRLIAIQTAKYPDCLALADLISGHAVITSPALDFSRVRMENRQEPELVGKAEPYITWKERREREGAEQMNQKYDWDTFGPRVVAMMAKGRGIPEIARELDYPYHAVRDYVKRHVPMKKPSEDTCPARREDYEIPETVNWTVTENPHPASVPPLHPETCNGLGADIQATEQYDPVFWDERNKEIIRDLAEKKLIAVTGEYQARIFERFHAQRAKGIGKYGQPLEDNPASIDERLEHLAQELTDGLMYIEWIKAAGEGMDFQWYSAAAMRTAQQERGDRELMLNGVFGLVGESGEVVDHLKKHLFQGHELNREHVADELGDVLWYVNLLAVATGCDLAAIAQGNIAKLQARYPGAGFDAERSINRAEVQE